MRGGGSVFAAVACIFIGLSGTASGQGVRAPVSYGSGTGVRVPISYSLSPTPHVTITNQYSSRLSGAVIRVSNTDTGERTEIIWFDSGVNFKHDTPIEIGASRSFPVGPADEASALQPAIEALTFEDGTSVGDSGWLAKLHARRKAAYDEISTVTQLLNQALAQHQSEQEIISSLKAVRASLGTAFAEPEARIPAGLVIYAAVSNLERGGITGSVGDPQRTIPAVILPIFAEWRGALKHYDRKVD